MSTEHEHSRWENYWSNGVEPGKMWDRVGPSPLLLKYVESTDYIPAGKALVPGCGRGYDLVALASAERSVIGLDISETGVAAAKDYLKTVPTSVFGTLKMLKSSVGRSSILILHQMKKTHLILYMIIHSCVLWTRRFELTGPIKWHKSLNPVEFSLPSFSRFGYRLPPLVLHLLFHWIFLKNFYSLVVSSAWSFEC